MEYDNHNLTCMENICKFLKACELRYQWSLEDTTQIKDPELIKLLNAAKDSNARVLEYIGSRLEIINNSSTKGK
jgi:hypothetical protein